MQNKEINDNQKKEIEKTQVNQIVQENHEGGECKPDKNDSSKKSDRKSMKEIKKDKYDISRHKGPFWIISLILFLVGLIGTIILLVMSWDKNVVVSFGDINQSILLKIFSVSLSLGGISFPLMLYNSKKNKNKKGWILAALGSLVFSVAIIVLCTFAEIRLDGYNNYTYGEIKYEDYKILFRSSKDLNNSVFYDYYVPFSSTKYYYCFTSYSYPAEVASYLQDEQCIELYDWVTDEGILIPLEKIYTE
ncbi:MAG: hypothetical protein ACI4DU_09090 [Lachnospiraceae bacterium]